MSFTPFLLDGVLWTAGNGLNGKLGHHGTENRPIFSPVDGLPPVSQVAIGHYHCVVLTTEGNVSIRQSLKWRHSGGDGVFNHQPHDCLLNRLVRQRSKKTSKFRATGLCAGISPIPVNSPHKRPVTRKIFPLDDVIMGRHCFWYSCFMRFLDKWSWKGT